MTSSSVQSNSAKNGIGGACAGVLTKSTVQPLDFLRTRLQVHDAHKSEYRLIKTVQDIIKSEGISCVYRGLSANLLGSGVNWGIYFFSYESWKRFISDGSNELSSLHHFGCGWISGVTAISVTNPIWCVKTRLQVDNAKYNGLIDCVRSIYTKEGILKFYRGLGPAYLLCLNPALQITFYERLKRVFMEIHLCYHGTGQLGSTDFLAMGAIAKMMSSTSVYPLQLLRSRLFQTVTVSGNNGCEVTQNKYVGAFDCAKKVLSKEGIKGFYRGLTVNLLKTVPSSALTFMFYENTLKLLDHLT
eukprot:236152_1